MDLGDRDERPVLNAWLASGLPLHAVRDHPWHERPVILCAFDGHRAAIHDMAGHIDAWRSGHGDECGSDESLSTERLWPTIRDKTLVHTKFGNRNGHGGIILPFPTRRAEGMRFIGERIYEDNQPDGEDCDCYVTARLGCAGVSPSCNSEIAISEFKVLGSHQE
jgi:hypothetical protein